MLELIADTVASELFLFFLRCNSSSACRFIICTHTENRTNDFLSEASFTGTPHNETLAQFFKYLGLFRRHIEFHNFSFSLFLAMVHRIRYTRPRLIYNT